MAKFFGTSEVGVDQTCPATGDYVFASKTFLIGFTAVTIRVTPTGTMLAIAGFRPRSFLRTAMTRLVTAVRRMLATHLSSHFQEGKRDEQRGSYQSANLHRPRKAIGESETEGHVDDGVSVSNSVERRQWS